jgi:hypothetical protein
MMMMMMMITIITWYPNIPGITATWENSCCKNYRRNNVKPTSKKPTQILTPVQQVWNAVNFSISDLPIFRRSFHIKHNTSNYLSVFFSAPFQSTGILSG